MLSEYRYDADQDMHSELRLSQDLFGIHKLVCIFNAESLRPVWNPYGICILNTPFDVDIISVNDLATNYTIPVFQDC